MISIASVLEAIKLAGAAAPAAKALFDQIVMTFTEQDQATLKAAYARAIERSDELHEEIQALK